MAEINGTNRDDVLNGTGDDDTISGLGGGDELYGGPGDDTLNGGDGWDRLHGDAGADTLDGGPGIDTAIYSFSPAGVTIDLSGAPDSEGYVRGSVGGDAEGDRLKNVENLWGSEYDDRLIGDGNDNELLGSSGHDTLNGGPGDDVLEGDPGNDTLNGGPGDDVLIGGTYIAFGPIDPSDTETFVFDAGSGKDTIRDFDLGSSLYPADTIQFTEPGITFSDLRIGRIGRDALVSWGDTGQSITLNGVDPTALTEDYFLFNEDAHSDSDDGALTGTAGADTLNGTGIADTIEGGGGNDILRGLGGDDALYGNVGDDTLNGGSGADALNGGPGSDTASYIDSNVRVLVRLHDARAVKFGHAEGGTLTGIEHLIGSRHNDILAGDGGDNRLEGGDGNDDLYGGPAGGDDLMYGGNGDDRIFGGQGNDTLTGGAGFDYLRGGPGDDDLVAGEGMDVMYGGTGQDTFIFSPSNVGGAIIADFNNGEDKIDLTAFAGINSMDDLDIISHGDNVRIDASGSDYLTTIILSDFDINNLDNSDFLF